MALYLICIMILAVALRIIGLNQSFWLDETAQAVLSKNPFGVGHFNADFQPPLFYYISHFWMKIGMLLGTHSESFLRLPSVFFGILSVWMTYKLVNVLTQNTKISLISSLLLATAPFHIYYSQEFRMYSMLTFVSLVSWYILWQKKYKFNAFINLIAIFTHYFGWVIIASQLVYMLLCERKRIRAFMLTQGLILLPWLVWIPTFIEQVKTSQQLKLAWPGWVGLSNSGFMKFPVTTLAKFTVGMIHPEPHWVYGVSVTFFTSMCMWTLIKALYMIYAKKGDYKALIFISCMWIVPLVCVWIGGIWISAATPWRIQFVLPALYISIAIIALHKPKSRIRTTMIIFLILQNTYFSGLYLTQPMFQRENWRDAIAYSDSKAGAGAHVITEFNARFAPIDWYSKIPSAYIPGSSTMHMTPESVSTALQNTVKFKKPLVVYSYLFEISDPDRLVESYLREHSYQLIEEKDFRGVGIIRTYKVLDTRK